MATFSAPWFAAGLRPDPDTAPVDSRPLINTTVLTGVVALFHVLWGLSMVAFGIALALCLHVTAITLGLSQLFLSAPTLYHAVRWAGIAYLAWLAWKALRSADEAAVDLCAGAEAPAILAHRAGSSRARMSAKARRAGLSTTSTCSGSCARTASRR